MNISAVFITLALFAADVFCCGYNVTETNMDSFIFFGLDDSPFDEESSELPCVPTKVSFVVSDVSSNFTSNASSNETLSDLFQPNVSIPLFPDNIIEEMEKGSGGKKRSLSFCASIFDDDDVSVDMDTDFELLKDIPNFTIVDKENSDLDPESCSDLESIDDFDLENLYRDAKNGNPSSQCELGMYFFNSAFPRKYEKAFHWFKKSADQRDVDALFCLGHMHEYGFGVEKDLQQAIKMYRQSANYENPAARCRMGFFYQTGTGVTKNMEKGFYWYKYAARQEFPLALSLVAGCYEGGFGVEKNMQAAHLNYHRAAEYGDRVSLFALGRMHLSGIYVDKDIEKACSFFKCATDKGVSQASEMLALLQTPKTRKKQKK